MTGFTELRDQINRTADLRKYEKQIESLKTQLAVYKEDMQKDAERIAKLERINTKNQNTLCHLEGAYKKALRGEDTSTPQVIIDAERRGEHA